MSAGVTGWLSEARSQHPEGVLDRLGIRGSRRARWPCPACGATREKAKGTRSNRGPMVVQAGKWLCNGCQEHGDSVDLVSWATLGKRVKELSPQEWAQVREWFGSGPAPTRHTNPAPPAPDYPPQAQVRDYWFGLCPLPESVTGPVDPPQNPPDPELVARLSGVAAPWWQSSDSSCPALARWLRSRAIDPRVVSWLDLVRPAPPAPPARPQGNERPVQGYGWPYCAVLPLWDSIGSLRSVLFRAVAAYPTTPDGRGTGPKSLALRDWGRAGLVLADPMGRALLEARGEPEPVDLHDTEPVVWNGVLCLCEGEMDFLTVATRYKRIEDGQTYAVMGTPGASGLSPAIAARITPGTEVFLYPHGDQSGGKWTRGTLAQLSKVGIKDARVMEFPAKDLNEMAVREMYS